MYPETKRIARRKRGACPSCKEEWLTRRARAKTRRRANALRCGKRLSVPDGVWKFLLEHWPTTDTERSEMMRDLIITIDGIRHPVEVWL